MPSRHRLEAEANGTVEKPAELQVPVALHAGVGGPPEGMRLDIRRHDLALELLGEVEDVMVDPQPCRDPPRVVHVAHRAASRVACAAPELHGGRDNVIALFEQQCGSH